MYAILDIETTGGKFNEEGITEIAIYKFDGHTVVDQFISLVNPEREIQPFVVNLTGINSNMLRSAPKFYEVAKRIVEMTEDCIIVAHNSEFDYRILRTEFSRLGFEFERKTLCTVELSKQLMPEQDSYSLGKLTRALGIPVSDRHRASGDALATVKLFKILLAKDLNKQIIQDAVKAEPKYKISTNHKHILDDLPSITGVYYLHDTYGKIIFIGKSKNIRNRVNQHFTSSNPKSKKMQNQVAAVTYEATGSELVAMLKESAEIKKTKPSFNRTMRRNKFTHALYCFTDEKGYINLRIDAADGRKKAITTFTNYQSGKQFLINVIEKYKLCPKLVGLDATKKSCFKFSIGECAGACIGEETSESYNLRVQEVIAANIFDNQDFILIDKGRAVDEHSVLLIEDGIFKGLGYYNLNYQITNKKVLESIITPMENNRDTIHIIQTYLRKNKQIKRINLTQ
ncbi:exonuclease domain-containing protein [Gelidibacter sediminis]|uniref:exonuclease domain-containing protein n=1 Tax=Gelidibacter sediminis TaxID=1608710 RepID=UPI00105E1070|nr:exonuclease domain-containing protein [Gelidibacter sediminis]